MRRLFLALLLAATASAQEAPWFVDVGKERGLEDGNAHRNVFADLDGDGWVDLVIDDQRVYRNVPDPARPGGRTFVKLEGSLAEGGARPDLLLTADLDDDGDADALTGWRLDATKQGFQDTGKRTQVRLLDHGAPGGPAVTGARVTATLPLDPIVCAAWLDYDLDGRLDLVTAGDYLEGGGELESCPVRLFRGLGDGAFEETTDRAGLALQVEAGHEDSRRPVYGLTTVDLDGNGWTDVLVCAYGRQRNLLYLNAGGRFTDVGLASGFAGDADTSGVYSEETKRFFRERYHQERADELPFRSNGNTFDAAVADADGDGDLDVFLAEITHSWAGPSSDSSSLLLNDGRSPPTFERHPEAMPRAHRIDNWNQGDLYAGWLDAQNDGVPDLVLASGDYPVPGDEQRLHLFVQGPRGTFADAPARGLDLENSAMISFADYDRDGDVDVLTGTTNMRMPADRAAQRTLRPSLFENRAGQRARWLELRLEGRGAARGGSNRDAIGARVVVTAGDLRLVKEVQGGRGHAGHEDARELCFGLNARARVDRVVVRWPTRAGTVTELVGLAADHVYVIHEPTPGAEAVVEDLGPH